MPNYTILRRIESLPKWYFGTSENYNKLNEINKHGLYFLTDLGIIMLNNQSVNSSIVLYDDGSRPLVGGQDKLYINSTTLEGFRFINDEWVKVIASMEQAEPIDYNDAIKEERVNGFGVSSIMNKFVADMRSKAVSEITWKPDTRDVIFKFDSVGHPMRLYNLMTDIRFNTDTRMMYGYDSEGNIITKVEIMDSHVIGGGYDDERKAIIFRMRDGSEVRLRSSALLRLFHGIRTQTFTSIVKNYIDGKNVLYGEINISDVEHNTVEVKEDGLYIPKPKDIKNMEEGQMYTIFEDYIVPTIKITLLATEEYVTQMKQEALQKVLSHGSTWLTRDKIIYQMNDTPSQELIPSMKLINDKYGIIRLT